MWTIGSPAGADDYRSTTWAEPVSQQGASALGTTDSSDLEEAGEGFTTVADEVERTPSAEIRRGGGEGAPAYLTLRGSDPAHVLVLLDRIPVHGALDTSFDLSLIPVELLGAMTVYRSNSPVQLGAPRPGGMVHLETRFRDEDGAHLSMTTGSYDTRRIHYAQQWDSDSGATLVSALYRGASNHFSYFDDNGTPLNEGDDGTSRRQNAQTNSGAVLLRNRARTEHWRLTTMLLGSFRSGGVPGIVSAPALQTRRQMLRVQTGFRAQRSRWPRPNSDLELIGGLTFDRRHYRDEHDELGVGRQDLLERAWLGSASLRNAHWLGEHTEIATVLEWTGESYHPEDSQSGTVVTLARRNTSSAGAQVTVRLLERRLSLDGGARLDLLFSRVARRQGPPGATVRDLLWSPRGGVSVDPIQKGPLRLQFYLSGGLGDRAPGFFELYGDRGTSSGNPDLRPETRRGYDTGVRSTYAGETIVAAVSYGWFHRNADDLIVFVENGVGVAVPQNIEAARLRGHEVAMELSWKTHLRIAARYTNLDATSAGESANGFSLPYRSRHSWGGELGGGWRWLGARWSASGSSQSYLDRRELRPLPARMLHDLEITLRPPIDWEPSLTLSLHNVFDNRVHSVSLPDGGRQREVPAAIADYLGYPLPGRAFYLTLNFAPVSQGTQRPLTSMKSKSKGRKSRVDWRAYRRA